jgi:hypothetical protein
MKSKEALQVVLDIIDRKLRISEQVKDLKQKAALRRECEALLVLTGRLLPKEKK